MERNTILQNLYEKDSNDMIKRISHRVENVADAEDIVHEAFTRALRFFDSFNPKIRPLETWFSQILHNVLMDHYRMESRTGIKLEVKEWELDPVDEQMLEQVGMDQIEKMIGHKPMPRAEVLYLYFIRDYFPREITQVMNINNRTVRQYVWEFRDELKELFV